MERMVSAGRTPWWRRRQREHFARAVDALPDPHQPNDPRLAGELAVVVMLRRMAEPTGPDDATRDRMRAKVFDELNLPEYRPSPFPRPTVPANPAVPANRAAVPQPRDARPDGRRPRRPGTRGRLVIALGAAFCLILALSGMTLLLSRNALPGDPLYAVRRTMDAATLGLTNGADARGVKHLQYAADRVGDLESLAGRYGTAADAPIGDYLTAFADFDTDATAGSADLTGYAVGHGPALLRTLRDWTGQQRQRIDHVTAQLPTTVRPRAGHSIALLDRIEQRATALLARDGCYSITSGATDDLGVLPATGPCDAAPRSAPGAPTSPNPPGAPSVHPAPTTHGHGTGTIDRQPPSTAPAAPPATPAGLRFAPPPAFPAPILAPSPGTVNPVPTTMVPIAPTVFSLPLPFPQLTIPAPLPGLPGIGTGE